MILALEVESGLYSRILEVDTNQEPRRESPLSMRLAIRTSKARVNGELPIEFAGQSLTSYSGLELMDRFLRATKLDEGVREVFRRSRLSGDYSTVSMVRLCLALLWIGGRRLSHVDFVRADPLVCRLARLRQLPHERTLSRWLKQFRYKSVRLLAALNAETVIETLRKLRCRRVTLDVDGSVVSTGLQVAGAARGYNPHRRKVPSYYPILAHVAQTGQIFAVRNRPGHVHDSRRSEHFIRDVVRQARQALGASVIFEVRLDGAFFQRPVLQVLSRLGVEYGLKVPMFPWLGLRAIVQRCKAWTPLNEDISYFSAILPVTCWQIELPVVVYRRRVKHRTRKNFQLDLFNPDDGHYEYSAVTSNRTIGPVALWYFMAGRGAQEKTLAELKDGFAFDSVPTNHYSANSAWQQLCVLAMNLMRRFQIETATSARPRTRKRTFLCVLESIKTARFKWLNVAGRLVTTNGTRALRLSPIPRVHDRYEALQRGLAAAA